MVKESNEVSVTLIQFINMLSFGLKPEDSLYLKIHFMDTLAFEMNEIGMPSDLFIKFRANQVPDEMISSLIRIAQDYLVDDGDRDRVNSNIVPYLSKDEYDVWVKEREAFDFMCDVIRKNISIYLTKR